MGFPSKGSIHALLHSVPQCCRRTLPTQASARDYGHSWASLGQSLWGHCFFLLGPCSVCALQESISQSCVSSGGSMVGLMATSSKRAYAIPRSAAPEPLPLQQATADPYLHRRHSNTVLAQSLWGLWVLVRTRFV